MTIPPLREKNKRKQQKKEMKTFRTKTFWKRHFFKSYMAFFYVPIWTMLMIHRLRLWLSLICPPARITLTMKTGNSIEDKGIRTAFYVDDYLLIQIWGLRTRRHEKKQTDSSHEQLQCYRGPSFIIVWIAIFRNFCRKMYCNDLI